MDWITNRKGAAFNIDISTKCPLQCSKCMRKRYKPPLSGQDCTIEEFDKITDFFWFISFCGQVSDPTAHPNFIDFLKMAFDKDVRTSVHTAATHRPTDWYRKAFQSNLDAHWIFGLDGLPKDSHQYRINQDGEKLWEVMKMSSKMGMNVDWQWIIFKYNWKDLKIGLSMSHDHDIKLVPVTSNRWFKNDPMKPPQEVIECDNIEDIFSLIEDQNDKKTST